MIYMGDTANQINLSIEQSQWLSNQLTPGVDYLQFGTEDNPQFLFFLDEAQWAEWLPKLPPAGEAEAKPMQTYKEMDDGWTFQLGLDGNPVPGEFRFIQFCMGSGDKKECLPSVDYSSGGFRGTRTLRDLREDKVRAKLLALGFTENQNMK